MYPSQTNFILVRCDLAAELNEALAAKGIGVRCFGNSAGLEDCIRISMGTREENDAVFAAIKAFAESEGQK